MNNEEDIEAEGVDFEWLHLSDGEDEAYEVFDYEVKPEDIYPSEKTKVDMKNTGKAPRYYNAVEIEPKLQQLLDNFQEIKTEILSLIESNEWTPWPEQVLYSGEGQLGIWKVIPLFYTFPAWDEASSKWVPSNTKLAPKTTKLLKSIPTLRTALFSRMGPRTRLSAHQGWADLANHVIRVHLPLVVPKNAQKCCGMWVEGHVNYHKEGSFVAFDDSKWHKAFNSTEEDRIILIFDILRPDYISKGSASQGHTEQLDDFIQAFQSLSTTEPEE